jgi:hypothetical protein
MSRPNPVLPSAAGEAREYTACNAISSPYVN